MIDNETVLTYSDVFTHSPTAILGYRENGKPIYNIGGGSVEVTADSDDDDDADTSSVSKEESTEEEEWTPPTREDYEKLKAEKSKADSEAAARKRYLRDAGFDPKTGKPIVKESVDLGLEDEDDEVVTETTPEKKADGFSREKAEKAFQRTLERETAKTEQRVRSQVVPLISAVPEALSDAGWNGKNLSRMLKLLDLDSVEVDSDGDIEGLTDQVEELKKDFPEFFKRSRMREAAKDVADTSAVGGGTKKAPASDEDLDWTARVKASLYGR